VLAIYPSWWPGLADVFGRRTGGVRIDDNVICGADEKVIYAADWSPLAPPEDPRPDAVDTLDVADLVDERAHGYEAPFPRGGFVTGSVLALADGRTRFDAGRIIPEGLSESFAVRPGAPPGMAALVLRTDGGDAGALRVTVAPRETWSAWRIAPDVGEPPVVDREVAFPARAEGRWHEIHVSLGPVHAGDRVRVYAVRGVLRDFHAWLVRE
jgi:hypothetical protein